MGMLLVAAFAAAMGTAPTLDPETLTMAESAYQAWEKGHYLEAQSGYRKAIARMSGNPELPVALNNLGEIERTLGHFREAEQLHRRALKLRESSLPEDDPAVAQSLNNLAEVLLGQNRLRGAEELERKALAITEKQFGEHHQRTAMGLTNLGRTLLYQFRYEEAEQLFLRAGAIYDALGVMDHGAAVNHNNLAVVYCETGRCNLAEQLYLQVRERLSQALGAEHIQVAAVSLNLAELYRTQKRFDAASKEYERALNIFERRLPSDHPDLARALAGYSAVLKASGRGQEARSAMARSRQAQQQHARDQGTAFTVDAHEIRR